MGYAVATDTLIPWLLERAHTSPETHQTPSLWLSSASLWKGWNLLVVLFVRHVKYSFSLALYRMTGYEGKQQYLSRNEEETRQICTKCGTCSCKNTQLTSLRWWALYKETMSRPVWVKFWFNWNQIQNMQSWISSGLQPFSEEMAHS